MLKKDEILRIEEYLLSLPRDPIPMFEWMTLRQKELFDQAVRDEMKRLNFKFNEQRKYTIPASKVSKAISARIKRRRAKKDSDVLRF